MYASFYFYLLRAFYTMVSSIAVSVTRVIIICAGADNNVQDVQFGLGLLILIHVL